MVAVGDRRWSLSSVFAVVAACSPLAGRVSSGDGGVDASQGDVTVDVVDAPQGDVTADVVDVDRRVAEDVTPIPGCSTSASRSSGQEDVARAVEFRNAVLMSHREGIAFMDDQGRIVVCGTRFSSTGSTGVVFRLTRDGTFDRSFGVDGTLLVTTGARFHSFYDAVIDRQGRIILVGDTKDFADDTTRGLVVRITPDGSLDPTFASVGWARFNPAGLSVPSAFRAVALRGDRIMAVGANGHLYFLRHTLGIAAVYGDDGTLDASFGGTGYYLDSARWYMSVIARSEGWLIAGTERAAVNPSLLMLSRLGAPVYAYGRGGGLIVSERRGEGFEVISDGAGGALVGINELAADDPTQTGAGRALVARVTPEGTVDATFGDGGALDLGGLVSHAYTIGRHFATHCNGQVVFGDSTVGSRGGRVLRFSTQGVLDARFGSGGVVSLAGISGAVYTGVGSVMVSPDDASVVVQLGTNTNDVLALRVLSP